MEKADYAEFLDQNTREVLALVKTCSEDQLSFKPDGQWNILEVLEHIIIVDKICMALLLKPCNKKAEKVNLYGRVKLGEILIEGRGKKVKASDFLQPKGVLEDSDSFEKMFLAERSLLKENVENGNITIDNSIHNHPLLGEMTIADWLNFIPIHAQRHMEQIKDLLVVAKAN